MAKTIAQKLRIEPNYTLLVINEPSGLRKDIEGLPPPVKIMDQSKDFDQVHWFVQNRKQLEKEKRAARRIRAAQQSKVKVCVLETRMND